MFSAVRSMLELVTYISVMDGSLPSSINLYTGAALILDR